MVENPRWAGTFRRSVEIEAPAVIHEGPLRTLASPRAPPVGSERAPDATTEVQLVPDGEFLEYERLENRAAESRELQLVLDPEFL